MIQRQQTLWLILSTAAALFSFFYPFVTGKGISKGLETDMAIRGDSSFLLLIFTVASTALSAIIIFLYKDRKMQLRLCGLGLLLSLVMILLYILEMQKLSKSTLALFAVLPFLVLAGYVMAFRHIRKDEKLVKSLDKLR